MSAEYLTPTFIYIYKLITGFPKNILKTNTLPNRVRCPISVSLYKMTIDVNMLILRKKWEVDTKATHDVKRFFRNKIVENLSEYRFSENERTQDKYMFICSNISCEKWEDIDEEIMKIFLYES